MTARSYLRIARPDHWFKNVFVLPGTVFAALLSGTPLSDFAGSLALGLLGICLVCSANYVLNEWLDASFAHFHPLKRDRPSVVGGLRRELVYAEYLGLSVLGLGLCAAASLHALWAAAALWGMGIVYNVEPLRSKDRIYLDVLSESINNPIRLAVGWFVVVDQPLPPASLLVGYWMLGGFLMAVKRYAELRFLGADRASLYRRCFAYYSQESLMISALFYASAASFFLGIFLFKYRLELLLLFPALAVAFAWYLWLGMQPNSPAQRPERLWREGRFLAFLLVIVALAGLAFYVELPWLDWMLMPLFVGEAAAPG